MRSLARFVVLGCLIAGTCSFVGCGTFSKKNNDDIYSPKPAYTKVQKKKKKKDSNAQPAETVDDFLALKRVPW